MFIDSYPSIIGCDVAGTIEEVGDNVEDFQKGDEVIGLDRSSEVRAFDVELVVSAMLRAL